MIVRVFEARLRPGAEEAFAEALRDDVEAAKRQPGLVSLRWGERVERGETHVIVVSVWRDLDAVQDWLGPGYLEPRYAPGEVSLVAHARVRHYEGLER